MYVNDLDTAKEFFVSLLGGVFNQGYHNEKTGFRSYFISFEDGARIEIMSKPEMEVDPKTPNRTGYALIAFSVGSREKVDELTEKIRLSGYKVISGSKEIWRI